MADDFEQKAAELQRRLQRLEHNARSPTRSAEATEKHASATDKAHSALKTAKEFNDNVHWLRDSWYKLAALGHKIAAVTGVVWQHSGPVRKCLWPALKWAGHRYQRFFQWAAYDRDAASNTRVFNKYKATVTIGFTAAMLGLIGYGAKPVCITLQQAFMALVSEKEAYTYFHGSETIEEGQLYSIKTTSQVPSSPESTTHMHVQSDLVYWLFYPEDIANAVPNEVAWGRVKYTGWRVKFLGWFPEVKDVEAVPLSELPNSHPAKSGHYYISHEELIQAERRGTAIPGTDLKKVLGQATKE